VSAPADTGHDTATAPEPQEESYAAAAEAAPEAAGIAVAPPGESGGHGSIDALFEGADAHANDVNAATMLADAFAPNDGRAVPSVVEPTPSAAVPQPEEASDDGFSFDQFFAGEAAKAVPPTPRDTEPAPGDAADVAQFNQWLSGLKKPS
jgi:hypothetical protein